MLVFQQQKELDVAGCKDKGKKNWLELKLRLVAKTFSFEYMSYMK